MTSSKFWIAHPAIDLTFFAFGWIPLFFAFMSLSPLNYFSKEFQFLFIFVLAVNFLHRHLTFPLVYGDREQFEEKPKAYTLLPLFFLVLTLIALYFEKEFHLFTLLLFLSVSWTIYHTIMQKMGILRIYSKKDDCGSPMLDRAVLLSWFAYLFLQLAALPTVREKVIALSSAGKVANHLLSLFFPYLQTVAFLVLGLSLLFTILYLRQELKSPTFHWPKNIFLFSVLLLYATFAYDFLVGYLLFAFSHAIEYLAFANVYTRKKYLNSPRPSWLAKRVKTQLFSMVTFSTFLLILFFFWKNNSIKTLNAYIVGSSFLHFLYDGWIWKIRNPKILKPLIS